MTTQPARDVYEIVLAAQEAAVADQFVLTDVPSGRRGAQAILEWSRLRKR